MKSMLESDLYLFGQEGIEDKTIKKVFGDDDISNNEDYFLWHIIESILDCCTVKCSPIIRFPNSNKH